MRTSAFTALILRHKVSSRNEYKLPDIAGTSTGGGETPRVNGYSFVDEDEEPPPIRKRTEDEEPTYRDLLAGQVAESAPNPFKLKEIRKREEQEIQDDYTGQDGEKQGREIEHLVLVTHGIGQLLGLK